MKTKLKFLVLIVFFFTIMFTAVGTLSLKKITTNVKAETFSTLKTGDILHVGDYIDSATDYSIYNSIYTLDSGSIWEIVRANITRGNSAWDDTKIEESNAGQYYVFKYYHRNDGSSSWYGYDELNYMVTVDRNKNIEELGYLVFEATDISDGLEVTQIGDKYQFSLHEQEQNEPQVKLNKTETTIIAGETETLTATVTIDNSMSENIVWSSDNIKVAEVDDNGKVTAKSVGNATITARVTNGTDDTSDDYTATCLVMVRDIVREKTFSTLKTGDVLYAGDYIDSATDYSIYNSAYAIDSSSVWEIVRANITCGNSAWDDTKIEESYDGKYYVFKYYYRNNGSSSWYGYDELNYMVTFDRNKNIEELGYLVFEATDISNGLEVTQIGDKWQFSIHERKQNVTQIELNKTEITIIAGENETLTAMVSPDNATNKNVVWLSDNINVAEVDNNGKVTAKSVGTATITAKATNGTDDTNDDHTATCVVMVQENEQTLQFVGFIWSPDNTSAYAKYVSPDDTSTELYLAEVTSEVTTPATCTEKGVITYTASYEGHTEAKTKFIDAIDHDYGEWTVITHATTTSVGLERRTCKNNENHFEERLIPKQPNLESFQTTSKSSTVYKGVNAAVVSSNSGLANDNNGVCVYGNQSVAVQIVDNMIIDKIIFNVGAYDENSVYAHSIYATVEVSDDGKTITVSDIKSNSFILYGSSNMEDLFQIKSVDVYYYSSTITYTKVEAKAPTYIEDGNVEYYISSDEIYYVSNGETYVETTLEAVTISKFTLTHIESINATCEKNGNIEYWYDEVNEKYFSDENGENEITPESIVISAFNHNYQFVEFVWTEYTAQAKYVCENDKEHVVFYNATITSQVTVEPTYDETGIKTYTATYDGHTDTKTEVLDILNHDYNFVEFVWTDFTAQAKYVCEQHEGNHIEFYDAEVTSEITTAPTCDESGVRTYTANYDGHTDTKTEVVDALNHNYQFVEFVWTEYTAQAKYVCENDETHVVFYDATITNEITTAPTCEETGVRTYTASYNGHTATKTEDIEAIQHNYQFIEFVWTEYTAQAKYVCENDKTHVVFYDATVTSEITTAPTCTETGIGTYTASYDNHTYTKTEIILALNHDYHVVVTESTCYEQGYTTHTCSRCNDNYIDSYTDALGHDLGEWIVTKEATSNSFGQQERACRRCGEKQYQVVYGFDFNPTVNEISLEQNISLGEKTNITDLLRSAKDEGCKTTFNCGEFCSISFDNNAVNDIVEDKTMQISLQFTEDDISAHTAGNTVVKLGQVTSVVNIRLSGNKITDGIDLPVPAFDGIAEVRKQLKENPPDDRVVKVYYVPNGDGMTINDDFAGVDKVDMGATYNNGVVTFKTNHFSTYIVVFEEKPSNTSNNSLIMFIILGAVLVIGLAVFAYVYFVKNDKKFSFSFLSKKQEIANSTIEESTENNIEETVVETTDEQNSTEENN